MSKVSESRDAERVSEQEATVTATVIRDGKINIAIFYSSAANLVSCYSSQSMNNGKLLKCH